MFTAEIYRQKAEHCRRLAKDLDAQSRASLENLAREYDDGAVLADRASMAKRSHSGTEARLERVD